MKKLLTLLLALCMVLSCMPAMASETAFHASALEAYLKNHLTLDVFFRQAQPDYADWEYYLLDDSMRYVIETDSLCANIKLYLTLYGIGEDDAIPALEFIGEADRSFTVDHLSVLVGKNVYTIDVSSSAQKYGEVAPNGENSYGVSLFFFLGTAGIDMLNDLYAADGECTLRIYHDKKAYTEIEQPAMDAYALFYEGLIASGYLTEAGKIKPSTERLLTKGIDKDRTMPTTTVSTINDRIWPVITPVPTPLANISVRDLAKYETLAIGYEGEIILDIRMRMYELGYFTKVPTQTEFTKGMVEYVNRFQAENGLPVEDIITPEMQALLFSEHVMEKATATPRPTATPKPTATPFAEPDVILQLTGIADWARYKGVPWMKQEIRNLSKESTVTDVTFLYYCQDENEQRLTNTATGEDTTLATIAFTLRPGRKDTTKQIKVEDYENVKHVWATLYGYTLEDGTEVIIPEREHVYWHLEYR